MTAQARTCLSDDELLNAFEDTTLPSAEWIHRAHLRVAYIYLMMYPFAEAVDRIRDSIRRYNLAHKVPSTPTRGYHETVTVAFMTLVASACQSGSRLRDSRAFLQLNPDLLDRRALENYYSNELLSSASARESFLAPDRCPLPSPMSGLSRMSERYEDP